MTFEEVWPRIKSGARATRKGWNGIGLHVELGNWEPRGRRDPSIPFVVIIGDGVGGSSLGDDTGVWFPSMGDLFADDWELL